MIVFPFFNGSALFFWHIWPLIEQHHVTLAEISNLRLKWVPARLQDLGSWDILDFPDACQIACCERTTWNFVPSTSFSSTYDLPNVSKCFFQICLNEVSLGSWPYTTSIFSNHFSTATLESNVKEKKKITLPKHYQKNWNVVTAGKVTPRDKVAPVYGNCRNVTVTSCTQTQVYLGCRSNRLRTSKIYLRL